MVQSPAWICGFELGDASEITTLGVGGSIQSTTVHSGNYALRCTNGPHTLTTGLAATQAVIRTYFRFNTLPGADSNFLFPQTAAAANFMALEITPGGNVKVVDLGSIGLTTTTGTAVLTPGLMYEIDFALDLAANGVVKVWVSGTLDINTTHTVDVSATPIDRYAVTNVTTCFFDTVRIDTGGVALIGPANIIARQPIVGGSPTYDSWTKSAGTDAGALWDNTPFSAADFNSTTTAAAAQTADLSSFGLTQAGHGFGAIAPGDTMNCAKISLIGKTSSTTTDGADSIRRRVGGADTDTAIAVYTTSDAYRTTAPFTGLTYANLTDGTTEIGVVKGTGTNTHTVEDIWLVLEYTTVTDAAMADLYGYQPPMVMDDPSVVDY